MLTVNELFAGIGAFRKALIRMGLPHEIVGISEIDRFAIKSYEAIYGEVRNYGDISKVEKLDYADLWTYGFPCQDISLAGKQAVVTGNAGAPRIRRLTPKECWRLMGFDDEDFEKARAVNSDTQLYKQAGNSIVVNVLEAILGNLLKEERSDWLDDLLES